MSRRVSSRVRSVGRLEQDRDGPNTPRRCSRDSGHEDCPETAMRSAPRESVCSAASPRGTHVVTSGGSAFRCICPPKWVVAGATEVNERRDGSPLLIPPCALCAETDDQAPERRKRGRRHCWFTDAPSNHSCVAITARTKAGRAVDRFKPSILPWSPEERHRHTLPGARSPRGPRRWSPAR